MNDVQKLELLNRLCENISRIADAEEEAVHNNKAYQDAWSTFRDSQNARDIEYARMRKIEHTIHMDNRREEQSLRLDFAYQNSRPWWKKLFGIKAKYIR